ncbi:MAG: hypothetical protein ACE5PM_07880 [Candidatus Hydrothermarchaeales archaeon]
MKVAYPCPECGEVIVSNKCGNCGHEILPQLPKPKTHSRSKGKKRGGIKEKLKKSGTGVFEIS